jgi:hypothetical protein
MIRKSHRLVITLVSAFLFCLLPGQTASASAQSLETLTCTGNIHTTYSPPLTSTVQNVTLTSTTTLGAAAAPLGTCLVLGALITSGTSYAQFTTSIACQNFVNPTPAGSSFTWNTGSTSTALFTSGQRNLVLGTVVVVLSGTVQSGFGAGNTIVATYTLPNADLVACLTTGLTELNGLVTVTIT